jgi:hypothetical protein
MRGIQQGLESSLFCSSRKSEQCLAGAYYPLIKVRISRERIPHKSLTKSALIKIHFYLWTWDLNTSLHQIICRSIKILSTSKLNWIELYGRIFCAILKRESIHRGKMGKVARFHGTASASKIFRVVDIRLAWEAIHHTTYGYSRTMKWRHIR